MTLLQEIALLIGAVATLFGAIGTCLRAWIAWRTYRKECAGPRTPAHGSRV